MATNNFESMNFDMPLVAYGMGVDYEERKKDYEEDFGEEYTEDIYYSDIDFQSEDVQNDIDEFNDKHRFFEVEQKNGYYQGIQFQVNFIDKYLDYDMIMDDKEFTDEDADYYYGDTAENIRKQVEKEKQDCYDFIMSMKNLQGAVELYKYAQFSNGEAIYREVGA